MKLRIAVAALAALSLSACGKSDAGGNATAAAPVASAAPPAGQLWTDVVSKTADGGYVMGNPNAPIKLLEYGSRTCPTCGQFGVTGMKPLEANYVASGKVSYEFRDFLVHAPDLGVALLGRCAGPAPFFPILEQMFQAQAEILPKLETIPADFQAKLQALSPAQQATAWVDKLGYVDFIKQRGVSEAAARTCLADTKQVEALAKLNEKGMADGVEGTPTFFLNGEKVPNAVTWEAIEAALKGAGA